MPFMFLSPGDLHLRSSLDLDFVAACLALPIRQQHLAWRRVILRRLMILLRTTDI